LRKLNERGEFLAATKSCQRQCQVSKCGWKAVLELGAHGKPARAVSNSTSASTCRCPGRVPCKIFFLSGWQLPHALALNQHIAASLFSPVFMPEVTICSVHPVIECVLCRWGHLRPVVSPPPVVHRLHTCIAWHLTCAVFRHAVIGRAVRTVWQDIKLNSSAGG